MAIFGDLGRDIADAAKTPINEITHQPWKFAATSLAGPALQPFLYNAWNKGGNNINAGRTLAGQGAIGAILAAAYFGGGALAGAGGGSSQLGHGAA